MNRFTNKEYLIDLTINTLEVQQPSQPTKVKCEVHYADDSYLKIQLQPIIKNGVAQFCGERLRIPFSSEMDLVFKLVKANKKQSFLGHYSLQVQKMLNQKQYYFKGKDKLEEANVWVDFQCRIIDKQLICESDTEEPELGTAPPIVTKSSMASVKLSPRQKYNKPLSELNSPFVIMKKTAGSHIPLPPEQFGKMLQDAQDILTKRQIFNQRHVILKHYSRDRSGRLRTAKIQSLQSRLIQSQKSSFTISMALYLAVGVIAFILGLKL